MSSQSAHEPEAKVMSAADVWNDADLIGAVLRQNLVRSEPFVKLQVPLSAYLFALDSLNRDELVLLRRRVDERLAA